MEYIALIPGITLLGKYSVTSCIPFSEIPLTQFEEEDERTMNECTCSQRRLSPRSAEKQMHIKFLVDNEQLGKQFEFNNRNLDLQSIWDL